MFPVRQFHLIALTSLALTVPSTAEPLRGQSALIPIQTRRDMVFDFSGQHLYISTSDGLVQRYNIPLGQLDASYNLGGFLSGIDIARNDSFLLVAQGIVGGSQGTIHKVNLSNGAVTNINYTRDSSEGGAWDVAVGSAGLAFVTTDFQGSGWTPLREINLATNAITVRGDVPGSSGSEVRGNSEIHRSADGTRLYFLESGSGGTVFTYNATTNAFGSNTGAGFLSAAAVNRTGTLLGTLLFGSGVSLDTAPSYNYAHNFSAGESGIAFNAQTDTLYVVNTTANQIIAYDTNTFAENFRINIGEPMFPFFQQFGEGTLVASPDGMHLALATPSGVRLFDVTTEGFTVSPAFGTPRDMVFDHAGQRLYITTAEGLVWPYTLSTSTFGTPFNVGGSPYGLDINADDSVLLVAQGTSGLTQSAFQKLNLATGAITNIIYSGGGSVDVAIASNGMALGTSGIVHQINPVTNAISDRSDAPIGFGIFPTQIHRSADRTRLYFLEGNSYNREVFTYSAPSDAFGPVADPHSSLDVASAAVNRNGTLLGTRLPNNGTSMDTAPDFNFVHNFNTLDGGIAFDAVQDTIYGVNNLRNQIIAYNTATFAEKFRFDIGENVDSGAPFFEPGKLVASQDGHYLALITPTTLRVFGVPAVPLTSVVSRKTHGAAGTFDINLPFDGNPGIECRSGGPNGEYTLVFTFGVNLTSVGSASVSRVGSESEAMISSQMINPSNPKQYIVNLTGVTDHQYLQVTLNNVSVAGAHTDSISHFMGVLIGDTSANRFVNSTDVGQTKSESGHALTNANFREDVNASGAITASDISFVKSKSGGSLPNLSQILN